MRHEVLDTAQAHRVELAHHQAAKQGLREVCVFSQRSCDVFEHRQVSKQRPVLQQDTDVTAEAVQFPVRHPRYHLSIDFNGSLIRFQLPGNQPQNRRFANAAWTHECDNGTLLDIHADAIEDRIATTPENQVPDPDGRFDYFCLFHLSWQRDRSIVQVQL